jgi:hypothetical protein
MRALVWAVPVLCNLLLRPDEVLIFPFGLSLSKPAQHRRTLR